MKHSFTVRIRHRHSPSDPRAVKDVIEMILLEGNTDPKGDWTADFGPQSMDSGSYFQDVTIHGLNELPDPSLGRETVWSA